MEKDDEEKREKHTNSNEGKMKKTDQWNRSSVCRVEKERRRDLIKTASFFVMLDEDVLLTDHFSRSGFHCAWVFILATEKAMTTVMEIFKWTIFIYSSRYFVRSISCFYSRSLIPNHLLEQCTLFIFFLYSSLFIHGDNRRNTLHFLPAAKLHKGMLALEQTHTHKERK